MASDKTMNRAALFAAMAGFLVAAGVAPQSEAQTAAPAATNSDALDEVTVTSRRRSESMQEVPLAITALGTAALEQQQITDSKGLSFSIPNLLVGQQTSNTAAGLIFLRGIGQDDSTPVSEPGVAIYVDDQYMPRTQGALIDILDMERVEVLRGPQGTLYGRNSTGGAIRYITRKPSVDEASGKAELTMGSFDRLDMRGSFSAPIVDGKLGVKLDLSSREQDGYMRRFSDGERLNGIDRRLARLSARWLPSETVTVDLAADVSRDRSDIYVGTPMKEGRGPNNRVPQYDDYYVTGALAPNVNTFDTWGASATIAWDLGGSEIKSVTAFRTFDQNFWGDLSSGEAILFDDINRTLEDRSFTQEIQWASRGDGSLQWVLGVFYMDESWDNLDLVLTRHDSSQDTTSLAAFGEATYSITDALSVTLGGRYTQDEKEYSVDAISLIGTPFAASKKKDWSKFSPKLAVDLQATDDLLLFVSYRNGYKVGAFQNFPQSVVDVTDQVQKPEDVNAYEVGFKSDWFDKRLRVNFAGFFSEYEDIQFQVFENLNFIARNADAEIWGTELEVAARPTTGLDLYGFISTLDTEITKSGPGVPPVGNKLRFAPELQYKLGFQYEKPAGNGKAYFGANYTWVDDIQFDAFNGPFAVQSAFDLVDARVGYEGGDGAWRVELSGKNLTDEKYAMLIQPYGGVPAADGSPGSSRHFEAPRTWALSIGFNF